VVGRRTTAPELYSFIFIFFTSECWSPYPLFGSELRISKSNSNRPRSRILRTKTKPPFTFQIRFTLIKFLVLDMLSERFGLEWYAGSAGLSCWTGLALCLNSKQWWYGAPIRFAWGVVVLDLRIICCCGEGLVRVWLLILVRVCVLNDWHVFTDCVSMWFMDKWRQKCSCVLEKFFWEEGVWPGKVEREEDCVCVIWLD